MRSLPGGLQSATNASVISPLTKSPNKIQVRHDITVLAMTCILQDNRSIIRLIISHNDCDDDNLA